MAPPSQTERRSLWLTDLIKLAGVIIALHEAFTARDPVVFGVASFMLAGAQGVENVWRRVGSG